MNKYGTTTTSINSINYNIVDAQNFWYPKSYKYLKGIRMFLGKGASEHIIVVFTLCEQTSDEW